MDFSDFVAREELFLSLSQKKETLLFDLSQEKEKLFEEFHYEYPDGKPLLKEGKEKKEERKVRRAWEFQRKIFYEEQKSKEKKKILESFLNLLDSFTKTPEDLSRGLSQVSNRIAGMFQRLEFSYLTEVFPPQFHERLSEIFREMDERGRSASS